MSLADPAEEKLVQEALKSNEWKEEHSRSSDGGTKVWYWLRRDKKVKMKNRRELGAYLRRERDAAAGATAATTAPPAAAAGTAPPKPATGGAVADPAPANPDATRIANMGVLGTDLDSMNDTNVCII